MIPTVEVAVKLNMNCVVFQIFNVPVNDGRLVPLIVDKVLLYTVVG